MGAYSLLLCDPERLRCARVQTNVWNSRHRCGNFVRTLSASGTGRKWTTWVVSCAAAHNTSAKESTAWRTPCDTVMCTRGSEHSWRDAQHWSTRAAQGSAVRPESAVPRGTSRKRG